MADYDFNLGEGDTGPSLQLQLLVPISTTDPLYDQYPNGKPADLTGATVVLLMRLADDPAAAQTTTAATVVGDPLLGVVQFDWLGYTGRLYNCRFKVTQNNGKKLSFLNDRLFTLFVSADP